MVILLWWYHVGMSMPASVVRPPTRVYIALGWRVPPGVDLEAATHCPRISVEDRAWLPPRHPDGGGRPDPIDRDLLLRWARRDGVSGLDGSPCSRWLVALEIESRVTSTYGQIEQPIWDAGYQKVGVSRPSRQEIMASAHEIHDHLVALRSELPGVPVIVYGGCPAGPAFWPIVTANRARLDEWRAGNDFAMEHCWHALDTVTVSLYTPAADAVGARWREYADGMLVEARRLAGYARAAPRPVYAFIRASLATSSGFFPLTGLEVMDQILYLARHPLGPAGVVVWEPPSPFGEEQKRIVAGIRAAVVAT